MFWLFLGLLLLSLAAMPAISLLAKLRTKKWGELPQGDEQATSTSIAEATQTANTMRDLDPAPVAQSTANNVANNQPMSLEVMAEAVNQAFALWRELHTKLDSYFPDAAGVSSEKQLHVFLGSLLQEQEWAAIATVAFSLPDTLPKPEHLVTATRVLEKGYLEEARVERDRFFGDLAEVQGLQQYGFSFGEATDLVLWHEEEKKAQFLSHHHNLLIRLPGAPRLPSA